MVTRKLILLLFVAAMPLYGSAQAFIQGRVLDATNNQPLSGVNLTDSTRTRGTVTDATGNFVWNRVELGGRIYISHLGYQEQEVRVRPNAKQLRILMIASISELPELVVSGSNDHNILLETPSPISLISRDELDRDNSLNIAEPINRLPGLYMHSGTLNTNRVTIRGIGSRSLFSTTKIRAYLNDIPLTTGDGETSIEDIDLSLIDRVEVLKGPTSSIYGAGLGGTINMKAQKAPYQNSGVSSEVSLGSFGLIRTVHHAEHSSDRINLRLSYNTVHMDGYRDNNEYDRQTLSTLTQFYPSKGATLTLWGSWIDLMAFIPSSIDSASFAEDPTQAAFTWGQTMGFEDYQKGLLGFNWTQEISRKWEVSSSLFANTRDSYELRPFNILEENSTALGGRWRVGYRPAEVKGKLLAILGLEFFRETFDWRTLENEDRSPGALLSDNAEKRRYANVFTEVAWTLPAGTRLAAGLNFNHTRYQYRDLFIVDGDLSGQYTFDNQWSPRLAINHSFTSNLTVYSQISHGFSPPTLSETLTPQGTINPDIQPETGYSLEVGSRGKALQNKLWWDVSYYSMFIKNLLVARRTGDDQFVGVNAGKTRHRGIDLTVNFDTQTGKSRAHYHCWLAYGLADYFFKEFLDGENDFSGNDLTGTPKHKLAGGVDWDIPGGLFGNANFLVVGAMPLRDDNSISSDPYALMNIKAGYRKSFSESWEIKLYAGISNLWDERYASMLLVNAASFGGNAPRYYYPGLPRNYFGGLKLKYNL